MSGRGERIRTFDTLVPNQVLYQTELRPESETYYTHKFIKSKYIFKYCHNSQKIKEFKPLDRLFGRSFHIYKFSNRTNNSHKIMKIFLYLLIILMLNVIMQQRERI